MGSIKAICFHMRPQPSLSCVIPCHNEGKSIDVLLEKLVSELNTCVPKWEIILIDDGSTDDTAMRLSEWATKPGFIFLQLSRNFGKEAALTAGLEASSGNAIVSMDADLQHPTALIPTFIQLWVSGFDMVYASRVHRQDESFLKRFGSRLFYRLINWGDRFEIPPDAGDFRLMDRSVVQALLSLPEKNRFMKGLYAWVGFQTVAVPYVPAPRHDGQSKFSYSRLLRFSLDGLTSFSTLPLRAVSLVGVVLALLGLGYGTYLTCRYFIYGADVSGWTTLVVGLLLFSGIQLISLGILGEYMGRIFEEVKGRPLYITRRRVGKGLDQ